MNTERVTVSLPAEVRRRAAELAERRGMSFSAAVDEALCSWMRGHLVDAWLTDYEDRNGAFTEEEMKAAATEMGLPYLPPGRTAEPAA
jgi:hypothetical protein